MTAPITGPVTKVVGSSDIPYYNYKQWYRQRPPYDLNLEYHAKEYGINHSTHDSYRLSGEAGTWLDSFPITQAVNKAYSKLVDQTSAAKAGVGISVIQWRQSVDMIAKRAGNLVRFGDFLANGAHTQAGVYINRVKFSRQGGSATRREEKRRGNEATAAAKRARSKEFAGAWLEYSFGWSPLLGDIYAAAVVLSKQRTDRWKIEGRATVSDSYYQDNTPSFGQLLDVRCTVKCRMQAYVRVANPNLRTLHDLGLVNPALVAWDAVPWSFVVNWFVNVEQMLSSFSDFVGLEVTDEMTTIKKDLSWTRSAPLTIPPLFQSGYGRQMDRTLAITKPKLVYTGVNFSPKRAVNAISVLLQQLPAVRRK